MGFLGSILRLALVVAAALAGNAIGDALRQPVHSGTPLIDVPEDGNLPIIGKLDVRPTNLVPAIVLALLAGGPRTVFAFAAGIVFSLLLGDRYEYLIKSPSERVSL